MSTPFPANFRNIRLADNRLVRFASTYPFTCLFFLAVFSNVASALFNLGYNYAMIVSGMSSEQEKAFWKVVQGNNLVMFSLCMVWIVRLFRPLAACRSDLKAGRPVTPERLLRCQRRLINLPSWTLCINLAGWLPGSVVFPLGICLLSNWDDAAIIWLGFMASFVVSALLATAQVFFLMEAFELRFLFQDFFQHDRPAQTTGVVRIPLRFRFRFYWFAVAVVPLLALLAVTLHPRAGQNKELAVLITLLCVVNSAVLGAVTGRTMLSWVASMAVATGEIAKGNFDYAIKDKRPGDLGLLTDHFNDMAAGLSRGLRISETFGQFVSPEVRDEILASPVLGGQVRVLTVLFADIRGFTQRSSGEDPEKIVHLLNRFLTLAVTAVEDQGGWVNKFLGDGFMALFGAPRPHADHADLAILASFDFLARLDKLNQELASEGLEPLEVGIGLHTGPALIGSIGATLHRSDGRQRTRREFTAIGETVNLAQRIEQLTKVCGGPILLSEQTRMQMKHPLDMKCLGPQRVAGCDAPLIVYRIDSLPSDSLKGLGTSRIASWA